jgi:sec-independent protein translocase protein TatA
MGWQRYFFSASLFAFVPFEKAGGPKMIEGLFQPIHLLVIAGIALLIFGPKKLPELGKGLGDGIRGFKAAMSGEEKRSHGDKLDGTKKDS